MLENEYNEFMQFLFSLKHPTYSVGEKDYQWSLDNMYRIDAYMGFPSKKLKYIHVAGTNGKGSTVSYLASLLIIAGYKVGYYRSPQLFDIRERFFINRDMISKEEVLEYFNKIRTYIESNGASVTNPNGYIISYSEFFISLAFYYFAKHNVDIAILETGIGGINDPTNIIECPELSIITSIGYDHTRLLGRTLVDIAREKCGIIKHNSPVIVGHVEEEDVCLLIEQEAIQKHARCMFSDVIFPQLSSDEQISINGRTIDVCDYQQYNLQTVSCALKELRCKWKINLTSQEIHYAIEKVSEITKLKGRWQICTKNPMIIADVADNPQAMKLNFIQLERLYQTGKYKRLIMILGITSKDKLGIKAYLPHNALYIITESHGFLSPVRIAEGLGVHGYISKNVIEAMNYYYSILDKDDLVYIGGSSHIVHDALLFLKRQHS